MFTSASSTPLFPQHLANLCFQEERIRVQDRAMLYKFGKDNAQPSHKVYSSLEVSITMKSFTWRTT